MLVLSRKESQQIQIGDDVLITVVRVAGDKVRIGVEAPREVSVMRTELLPRQVFHHAGPDARHMAITSR